MTKHLCFLIVFLLTINPASAAEKPLRIVASIKPVHSLVAAITEGVLEPELLMSSNQSPHHYSLRPSERKMLAEADLVFWIGPNMESFMPRLLDSLENKNRAVALIQTPGLTLLSLRAGGHMHSDDEHDDHDAPLHDAAEASADYSKIDAHIWLNTRNAELLLDAITQQIITADPAHRPQYQHNNQRLHAQVAELRTTLQASLRALDYAFLTYHDGYQYFETEFDLHNVGFVTSAESQPGARRISELKKIIQTQQVECIFYDAPEKPAILKSLLSDSRAGTAMLDPVGFYIAPGKNNWFEIMHALAKQFINCPQRL